MQNQENIFEFLIKEACDTLGLTNQELKSKYKDLPICLMEYIENEIHEPIIEVRFDDRQATLSISFNKEDICDASFLFFDNMNDEDLFLEYVNERVDYDFKRSRWIMTGYYLKVKPPTKYETAFCFYKE